MGKLTSSLDLLESLQTRPLGTVSAKNDLAGSHKRSNAERQRNYRNAHHEEYKRRNAQRMKEHRHQSATGSAAQAMPYPFGE